MDYISIYSNTLKGYNKLNIVLNEYLENPESSDLDSIYNMLDNFKTLCGFYVQYLKLKIYKNPFKLVKNLKNYKRYCDFVLEVFNELNECYINEINQQLSIPEPKNIVVSGFKNT